MEHTKGQVNRAGRLWATFLQSHREGRGAASKEFDAEELSKADEVIAWWRSLHAKPLSNVNANLRHYLSEQVLGTAPTQRLKRFSTIVDKLCREPTMQLTQMADIGGCRAVLLTQADVDAVSRRLKKNWDILRTRDYVRTPKASGYRAVHHIVRRGGYLVEVQLRTPLQDTWANEVERVSRRLGVGFKSGLGPNIVHDYYVYVSEFFALKESGAQVDKEFMDGLLERYRAAEPYLSHAIPPEEMAK